MSAVELLAPADAGPHNPRWHELRRTGVSASDIAQVLGISPWGSAFSLYWQKREGWETEGTPEMDAGRRAEPVIADWFADECDPHENLRILPAGLYAHAERPWQLATPDRLIHAPCLNCDSAIVVFGPCEVCRGYGISGEPVALIECKYLIDGWDGWGEPHTDDVPVHYRAQCLWQLDVLGVDEVYLAAWHGAEFRCYTIRRDEKDLRMMRAAGAEFMGGLLAGDPPDIDGHPATVRALKAIHPSIEDTKVEVPMEFAEGYRRARLLAKRTGEVLDRYEARARHMLGNGRRLMCNGHLVCSRSIYDQSGDRAELLALDGEESLVDRLNPGRATSYLIPKMGKAS